MPKPHLLTFSALPVLLFGALSFAQARETNPDPANNSEAAKGPLLDNLPTQPAPVLTPTPLPFTANPAFPLTSALIPGLNTTTYPRVTGSPSTAPLARLLAATVLGVPAELRRSENRVRFFETGTLFLSFPKEAPISQWRELLRMLEAKGTHRTTYGAYAELANDQADMIFVGRPPTELELNAAQEKNVEFELTPVALDALVFQTHSNNSLKNLMSVQIRDIISGQITNWQAIGGSNAPIDVYTRDRATDSEELVKTLVLDTLPMTTPQDRFIPISGAIAPLDRLLVDKNAFAFSTYYYANLMNPTDYTRLISINGVAPSPETIASHVYPLTVPVYAVTRKGLNRNSPAIKLRDWMLTPTGKELVAQSGYVPMQ